MYEARPKKEGAATKRPKKERCRPKKEGAATKKETVKSYFDGNPARSAGAPRRADPGRPGRTAYIIPTIHVLPRHYHAANTPHTAPRDGRDASLIRLLLEETDSEILLAPIVGALLSRYIYATPLAATRSRRQRPSARTRHRVRQATTTLPDAVIVAIVVTVVVTVAVACRRCG